MDIGLLHLHVTAALLLLISLLFKTGLLLLNRKEMLDKFRGKTKVVEMIVGALILVTGGYLAFKLGFGQPYLLIKTILIFIAIPLSIVGLKKGKKGMAIIGVLLFVYIYGIGETKSATFKKKKLEIASEIRNPGRVIYQQLCISCHGENGNKGVYKAPDLTKSNMEKDKVVELIKNGKNLMPGVEDQIDEQQLELLADYLYTIRE